MAKMKAIQVKSAGGDFELVERNVPEPPEGWVLVKVEACGICHSDAMVKDGLWPGIRYPRVPGHEVVGRIEKLGPRVNAWKEGQRVGVGWHGGHCFRCDPCRRGDFINCANALVTGITHDGGYAQYMVAPEHSLALVPGELESAEAAPLLCAGVTTYNALRNSGARAGDLVAVQGIGGLGHLALQYADKMGFRTAAISQGPEKKELALALGADIYIDSGFEDPGEKLAALGGARVILATAPDADSITPLVNGLGVNGNLVLVGAAFEPIRVSALQLIPGRRSVSGWPSGHARDSEDTLDFSALKKIRARIEVYPLEKAGEAYARMLSNKARFRVVLKP